MTFKVNISLKQYNGKNAIPIVEVGQKVKRGQTVAIPKEEGVYVHSSVTGKVTSISEDCIEILTDAVDDKEFLPLEITEEENLINIVQKAGIVGMGGGGYPTYLKLKNKIKGGTVIANGVECEPILVHNVVQMETEPELICRGLKYVMSFTQAAKGVIAIKEKNKKAIEAINKVIDMENIEIKIVEDIYPAGEERALVAKVCGILLPPSEIPLAAKSIVLNVETLSRIAEAVEMRKPLIERNLTLAGVFDGKKVVEALFDVPIGLSVKDLCKIKGYSLSEYDEVRLGGPFMGEEGNQESPITKKTNAVIVTPPISEKLKAKVGILVCACGAKETRLLQLAKKMGASLVGIEKCKNLVYANGRPRCKNPGNCPGQAERVLRLKKLGAECLLISTCTDCTNTVVEISDKMGLKVIHHTDHVLETLGYPLLRKIMV